MGVKKHGFHGTRINRIWIAMNERCRSKKHLGYKYYGGKGIKVCKRWEKFENFYEDMKDGYNDNLTIDRIDSNGNYCKENCRWVTPAEQARNRKDTVYYKGECATDASKRLGGGKDLIAGRLFRGWAIEKAFTTKVIRNSN